MKEKDRSENVRMEKERKKRDFKVGFLCAVLIVGAVAAVLLIILNL